MNEDLKDDLTNNGACGSELWKLHRRIALWVMLMTMLFLGGTAIYLLSGGCV